MTYYQLNIIHKRGISDMMGNALFERYELVECQPKIREDGTIAEDAAQLSAEAITTFRIWRAARERRRIGMMRVEAEVADLILEMEMKIGIIYKGEKP